MVYKGGSQAVAEKPKQTKVAGEIPTCCIPCAINAAVEIYFGARGGDIDGIVYANGNELIAGLAAVFAKLVAGLEDEEHRALLQKAFAGIFSRELTASIEHGTGYEAHVTH
jgi:hypothetical protein